MSEISKEKILEALSRIEDPVSGKNLPESGLLSEIFIQDDKVIFSIVVERVNVEPMRDVQSKAKQAVEALDGVKSALITLTSRKEDEKIAEAFDGTTAIKHIILVASGKGGVGKSTVAANLAVSFAQNGKKVGLLDADIYGSSQPRMMGAHKKPELDRHGVLNPLIAHGVKFMSIGLFVSTGEPIVWRGPRIHSAISQLLKGVNWGELDILVVDMPPGTGDVQLSIASLAEVSGAVIVTTPQEVALSEARKGITMFKKVNIPTLGIIENMSYHICEHCGARDNIFDSGKSAEVAREMMCEFLGEIPINSNIRIASDKGIPFVSEYKDENIGTIYINIANRISAILSMGKSCKYKSPCGSSSSDDYDSSKK